MLQACCDHVVATTGPIPNSAMLQLFTVLISHTPSPHLHARALAVLVHAAADSDKCCEFIKSGIMYRFAAVMAAYSDVPDIQHAALSLCALFISDRGKKSYIPHVGHGGVAQAASHSLPLFLVVGDIRGCVSCLDVLSSIASISSKRRDIVTSLTGIFQLIGSCMDMPTSGLQMLCSAYRLLVSISSSPQSQAVLSTVLWLHRFQTTMRNYCDSAELLEKVFSVMCRLPPISDELVMSILPHVITAVQIFRHGRVHVLGYGFLVKYKHLRDAFLECEGGTEVHEVAVSLVS